MIQTAAIMALNLLDDIKPRPIPRAEVYISQRVPMLELVQPGKVTPVKATAKKPARRKKHVCEYGRSDIWATFALGLGLGSFLMYLVL